MDAAATVGAYFTCEGRNSTYCNPAVDKMQQDASVLAGAEREKAYQNILKTVYDDYAVIPVGHPDLFFGMTGRVDWKDRLDGFMLLKEMKLKS